MTVNEIMAELQVMGSESIKKILLKHGVKEPFFGVKVEQLKTIQKKVKTNYQLAKDLYATGNADAQYLAGLIADDAKMTKADLRAWAGQALSDNISGNTVPWVAAESNYGYEMGMEWIANDQEYIAVAGWATISALVSLKPDDELDFAALTALLDKVEKTIHTSPNRVRGAMNNFIISVGSYVAPLSEKAIAVAKAIGPVTVIKEGTACKTPAAVEYIEKAKSRGSLGKKKKTVKC